MCPNVTTQQFLFSWISPCVSGSSSSSSSSTGASDVGQSPRLPWLHVARLARCLCPYGWLSCSPSRGCFVLSVLTAASQASKASRHMENAVKFVFQACSHYWKPRAAWARTLIGPRRRALVSLGSYGCLACVHGVKVANTCGSLELLQVCFGTWRHRKGRDEGPPGSLQQRQEQHG